MPPAALGIKEGGVDRAEVDAFQAPLFEFTGGGLDVATSVAEVVQAGAEAGEPAGGAGLGAGLGDEHLNTGLADTDLDEVVVGLLRLEEERLDAVLKLGDVGVQGQAHLPFQDVAGLCPGLGDDANVIESDEFGHGSLPGGEG